MTLIPLFNLKIRHLAIVTSVILGVESRAGAAALKLGIFLPMSGGMAKLGEECANGVKLAVDEINAKKETRIDYVLEDDKSGISDAASAVKKLIDVDHVQVVVGGIASSNTNAAAPLAQAAKVPLVTPASTAASVTGKGEYISRLCFVDEFQGSAMARFAHGTLKRRTAVVMTDNGSDYSAGLAAAFQKTFEKLGGKVVGAFTYSDSDQDFSATLNKIRALKAELVFVPGYAAQVGPMIRQARAGGLQAVFLGGDGWASPQLFELAGEAIIGNYYAAHFGADDPDGGVPEFVKKFTAKYGHEPSDLAALGYDSVYFVLDAFRRAHFKTDPIELMKAINATRDFSGVTGVISLDAQRNARKPLTVLETQATRATFKQRVNP